MYNYTIKTVKEERNLRRGPVLEQGRDLANFVCNFSRSLDLQIDDFQF
jgi:hypothetical protein